MTSAAATPVAAPRAGGGAWFRSAPFDLLLILCVPFLTWPLLTLAQARWGPDLLGKLILLTATGHYFATFVRTYGDRDLFQRFRTRFLLLPVVLLATCAVMFATGTSGALLLVTAMWAFWHWLAQAFGFARIYDMKRGSFRPLTARLDKALVIVGFVGAVTLNDGSLATFGKVFLDAGVPLPSAAQFAGVQTVVLAALVAVAALYLGNLGWAIAKGLPWSWQKQLMHVTTIGYYWFAFAWLPNVLIAYVLYELFHDVQYYAITWLTCRQRVRRPGVAPWFTRMFRPGPVAVLGFVAAMTAFGGLDLFGRRVSTDPTLRQVATVVFITAALLHYYYDGFIWKAREASLGGDLGIQGGLRAAVVPGLRHAAEWGLFFVPLIAIAATCRPVTEPRARAEALASLAPNDFLSRAELGLELAKAGEREAAAEHYRAAIALHPDYGRARANYGATLELLGELDEARTQYERALALPDRESSHAQAHVNLGVLLLMRGDSAAAQEHLRLGAQLGGAHPIGRMLGVAKALPASATRQKLQLYSAVLQLEADQPEARFELGKLQLQQRNFAQAVEHLAVLAQRVPNFVPGLVALATAQAELGQLEPARATMRRALQYAPTDADVLALQRRLGGG